MGLYLFAPGLAGSGPLINALGLSGVVAIVVGIRLNKPRARAAWWLFAAGQFLFFCGDLYTYSYPKLFGADVGFPSIGDALYLAVYPVLMAGFVLLIRRRNPRPDRAALIDALILTIGFALLSWVFLIAPNVHLSGPVLAGQGRLGRLSARRRPASRGRHPPRRRFRKAYARILASRQQCRLPDGYRLGVRLRAAEETRSTTS